MKFDNVEHLKFYSGGGILGYSSDKKLFSPDFSTGQYYSKVTQNSWTIMQIERLPSYSNDFRFLSKMGHIGYVNHAGATPINNYNNDVPCQFFSILSGLHSYLCVGKNDNKLYQVDSNQGNFILATVFSHFYFCFHHLV